VRRTILDVLTVEEAARRVGRSPDTVRRWIRSGRLPAATEGHRRVIDPADLDAIRDELYPMLPLRPEWQQLEDGTAAPNWVAAVALSRSSR
jgi:excisionase family DNA binding protein